MVQPRPVRPLPVSDSRSRSSAVGPLRIGGQPHAQAEFLTAMVLNRMLVFSAAIAGCLGDTPSRTPTRDEGIAIDRTQTEGSERFDTIIIGGGQAGLAMGYQLAARSRPFVILDASQQIGDAWRTRWDSLRLFTPARYDGLEGLRFPAPAGSFPTKDEMADYLQAYAKRFELPVRSGVRIDGLSRQGAGYVVTSRDRRFEANQVVVATGVNQIPRVPVFAEDLDPGIVQLHSHDYLGPSQLKEGRVLVVGVGNSGAEIAFEVVRSHETWLSGKPAGQIPFRHGGRLGGAMVSVVRFVGQHVLTKRTPIGRKVGSKLESGAAPLIRVRLKDLTAAGVEQVARTAGIQNGMPVLEDERVLDVANVIWCTGFRPDFGWIDLPAIGEDGVPVHERGIARGEPGLYFMGLTFQYAATSDTLPGMNRDAAYIADHMDSHRPTSEAATS